MAPIDSPEMPTQLVARVLAYVRTSAKGDAGKLRAAFGLPPSVASDPMVLMPVARLYALLDAAERETGDTLLGVNVARLCDEPNLVAFACRGAPDLRSALARCFHYVTMINDRLEVTSDESAGRCAIHMRITGEPLGLSRHGNEYWVTSLLLQARGLSGAPCLPDEVWFAHAAPRRGDVRELARVIGTEKIAFGRDSVGISLSSRVLDAKLVTANPALLAHIDRYAQGKLARRTGEGPFAARVRRAVIELIPSGAPSVEEVARACGVSARTLQRRLHEDGATFRSVLDSVRADLSTSYVGDKALKLDEVASLLGYAGAAGLVRAHRRWTGETPRGRGKGGVEVE